MNKTTKKTFLSLVTDIPIDTSSDTYKQYEKTIQRLPNQALYIYSFSKGRMLFAAGWEKVLGYQDSEVHMILIANSSTPEFQEAIKELDDKAFSFLQNEKEHLEEYSYIFESQRKHKNGSIVPVFTSAKVHKANDGKIEEIIGVCQIVPSLKFGKVMQFTTYGPKKEQFESSLNKDIFTTLRISNKEKEAIELASKGYVFKEIAKIIGVSHSAIEKRIIPLYKRFGVKNLPHLICFAYKNHILP